MSELRVFHLPGAWGLPSVSPFCLKLDAFLRLSGIEHESLTTSTPFAGPKKKAPWIEYKGHKLGDSSFIITFLEEEFGVDVDAHLSDEQRGISVAVQRLVEENLYWAMVYDRWVHEENWPILKGTVLGDIAAPIRMALAPLARRSVKKQLAGHGMGLHSKNEIERIAQRDLDALAAILGNGANDGPYLFGEKPSLADATVYSVLANIQFVGFASPMKAMIEGHLNLTKMIEWFRDDVYPQK